MEWCGCVSSRTVLGAPIKNVACCKATYLGYIIDDSDLSQLLSYSLALSGARYSPVHIPDFPGLNCDFLVGRPLPPDFAVLTASCAIARASAVKFDLLKSKNTMKFFV